MILFTPNFRVLVSQTGMLRNEINPDQLCHGQFGAACTFIGFGTHTGTVAAAHDWSKPLRIMTPYLSLRSTNHPNKLLPLLLRKLSIHLTQLIFLYPTRH